MIKIENVEICGWEHAIRGMRNPYSIEGAENNSWDKSDSYFQFGQVLCKDCAYTDKNPCGQNCLYVGPNDQDLMQRLRHSGTDHRKFMRMITVYVDITAPLYWWKEFDTYKVGTVANSCSTMHKIAAKEFTLEDFSCEYLTGETDGLWVNADGRDFMCSAYDFMQITCDVLNHYRQKYLETKGKKYWWQMIQLLPSSYNQKRTVMLNYEVLANIYKSRKDHRLDEWKEHENIDTETLRKFYDGEFKLRDEKSLNDIGFCDWIKTLPYSELITGEEK